MKWITAIFVLGAVGAASSCSEPRGSSQSEDDDEGQGSSSSVGSAGGGSSVSSGGAGGGAGGGASSSVGAGGGASSSGGAGSGGATSSSSGGMPELSCASYCAMIDDKVDGACLDANDQYSDALGDVCDAICETWPTGALADTSGNTLGCRIYHAGAAGFTDPATHCPHAGPFGDGVCGDACENFCYLAMTTCAGANAAFADMATCITQCGMFENSTPGSQYSTTNTSGDSFGCRAYHLTAAVVDPAIHCPHIKTASVVCQ